MPLSRYIDRTLDAPISIVRRLVISIVICAAAAIGALFYLASAAVIALEAVMSPAWARLIIGGALLLISIIAVLVPRRLHKESVVERAQEEAQSMTREQKIALIIEALMAGFSLSSRRSPRKESH
ncbi:MAG: phage holin family protein [Pseudomonadota bacterium]|nr:phage holin family protein [Pseudomonadota bacterium]